MLGKMCQQSSGTLSKKNAYSSASSRSPWLIILMAAPCVCAKLGSRFDRGEAVYRRTAVRSRGILEVEN